MSQFKEGDWVQCIDTSGTDLKEGRLYSISVLGDDASHVRIYGSSSGWLLSRRFKPAHKEPDETDHPTLSDFDRIRLETAATIAAGMYVRHPDSFANRSKDLARFSLELADNQINLIMDNPFKGSE